MNRRQFLTTGGLAASVGLAGCSWPVSDGENSGQTVAPELQGSPTVPDAATSIFDSHPLSGLWTTRSTLVAYGSDDSRQYVTAFDAKPGTPISESVFDDGEVTAVIADAVFVETDTGTEAVTVTDDTLRWECEFSGTIFDAVENTAVVLERGGNSEDGRILIGLDTEEWTTRWRVTTQAEVAAWGPEYLLTVRQSGSGNETIVCRSTHDGEVLWSTVAPENLGDIERSLSFGGTILLVSGTSMVGFRLQDGVKRFSDTFDPPFGVGSFQPPVASRWIVTDSEQAFVGEDVRGSRTQNGSRIRTIDATDGIVWTVDFNGPAARPVAVGESLVVELLGEDGVGTIGLNPADGTVLDRERGATVASGDRGPYVLDGQTLTALAHDGSVRWQSDLTMEAEELREVGGKYSVELTEEMLFVGPHSGVTVLQTDDGSKRLDASGFGSVVDFVPMADESGTDDRVFVASTERLFDVSL